jgi:putative glycosyltransferase (TIGR04348 family)
MPEREVMIVSPASKRDNNGNWQTADRWAHALRGQFRVTLAQQWHDGDGGAVLIALHAVRSAAALAAFAATGRPTIVVLTGTDLYRDLDTEPAARRSLALATRIVVLQEAALALLPAEVRGKARVIYQSAPTLSPRPPAAHPRQLDFCLVGHLRPEKDPQTFFAASALVRAPKARFVAIGSALDPALGAAARAAAGPRLLWLGSLPHAQARQRIRRSHALVVPSRMEGGANVIIEAVTCGVPVLASAVDGNRGMLGDDYAGYFPLGDAASLAALADRTVTDPAFHALLRAQCARRAPLFAPTRERAAVLELVRSLT